jgi:hypothetical protein
VPSGRHRCILHEENKAESELVFLVDVLPQLIDFYAKGYALLAFHAGIGIGRGQKMFELVLSLFQVDHILFLRLVKIDLHFNAATADIRVQGNDFFTQLFFIVHVSILLSVGFSSDQFLD